MNFLENQITNFINQYKRILSFNKTMNNKLAKKDVFANATSYLLTSLGNKRYLFLSGIRNLIVCLSGGDESNISCGDSGSNDTTSASVALSTYYKLKNCSNLVPTISRIMSFIMSCLVF